MSTFRAKLGGGFYRRWKNEFAALAWNLLESRSAGSVDPWEKKS